MASIQTGGSATKQGCILTCSQIEDMSISVPTSYVRNLVCVGITNCNNKSEQGITIIGALSKNRRKEYDVISVKPTGSTDLRLTSAYLLH